MSNDNLLAFVDREQDTYTAKMSDVARTLLIAAVGIVWVLGGGTGDPSSVLEHIGAAPNLRWALLLAVIGLVFDCCQYAWPSWWLPRYGRVIRALRSAESDGGAPLENAWRKTARWGLTREDVAKWGDLSKFMKANPKWQPRFHAGLTRAFFWVKVVSAGAVYVSLALHTLGAM
jgi:hypothetical protein